MAKTEAAVASTDDISRILQAGEDSETNTRPDETPVAAPAKNQKVSRPKPKRMEIATTPPKDEVQPEPVPTDLEEHACGLPRLFVDSGRRPQDSHRMLTAYVNQYVPAENIMARKTTRPEEVAAYRLYRQDANSEVFHAIHHFIVARRLWAQRAKYPLKPAPLPDVDNL